MDRRGKFHILEREKFDNYVAMYTDRGNMAIIVKPYRKSRSRQEEKYYHAVTKMMVAEAMSIAPDEAHEFLCNLLLRVEESAEVNGKTIRFHRVRSTTELDDKQYREFWVSANQWASLPTLEEGLTLNSGLGIYIPDPNEADWEDHF